MRRTLPTLNVAALLTGPDIPCEEWTEERLRAICKRHDRHEWNALHVLALTEVPAEDRIWLACHEALCPSAVARRFAVDVAAQALRCVGATDERSWEVLDAALAYERGEIDDAALKEALKEARNATRGASSAASSAASSTASWTASWAAADAARDAASAVAAWAAACDAARAASWAARAAARIDHCDLLGALLLRWLDGQDILANSVERAEETS